MEIGLALLRQILEKNVAAYFFPTEITARVLTRQQEFLVDLVGFLDASQLTERSASLK